MSVDRETLVNNEFTIVRKVFTQFLKSFFRHSPQFEWDEDSRESRIVVLDSFSDYSDVNESADRVIVQRQAANVPSMVLNNTVRYDHEKYYHQVVKPYFGSVNLFCESTNDVQVEYIASRIQSVIIMHRAMLEAKGVAIANPRVSEVQDALSGRSFKSLVVNVPTMVVGRTEYELTNELLLQEASLVLGVSPLMQWNVKTE